MMRALLVVPRGRSLPDEWKPWAFAALILFCAVVFWYFVYYKRE